MLEIPQKLMNVSLSVQNSFENALSQFQQLSDFDECHEGGKQEEAEGARGIRGPYPGN